MKRVTFPTGRANKRLTFQTEVLTSDGRGGNTSAWVDAFSTWGTLEPVRDRERWAGEQVQREVTHNTRIRYRTGVTTGMRFQHAGRTFSITGVIDEGEQHAVLVINAREVTPLE